MKEQIMKLAEDAKDLRAINELAESLRQIGAKEELKALSARYKIDSDDLEAFIARKRYWLVDEGICKRDYQSGRSKILDEMGMLNDANFGTPVGSYLLTCCSRADYEKQILKPQKTLMRCIEFLMKKAYEIAKEGQKGDFDKRKAAVAVQDADVFAWVDEYYFLDDMDTVKEDTKEKEQEMLRRGKDITGKKTASKTSKGKKRAVGKPVPESGKQLPKKEQQPMQDSEQVEGQLSLTL